MEDGTEDTGMKCHGQPHHYVTASNLSQTRPSLYNSCAEKRETSILYSRISAFALGSTDSEKVKAGPDLHVGPYPLQIVEVGEAIPGSLVAIF